MLLRNAELFGAFGQVGVMGDGASAKLGRQQQAAARTHHTVGVGTQFKTFATRRSAIGARVGQEAHVQRCVLMVGHQRGADLAVGVIKA